MTDPSSWLRRFQIYDPIPVALPITREQVVAARKQLCWSRDRLAAKADVPHGFIVKFERSGYPGPIYSRERSFDALVAIRAALIEAGVNVDDLNVN